MVNTRRSLRSKKELERLTRNLEVMSDADKEGHAPKGLRRSARLAKKREEVAKPQTKKNSRRIKKTTKKVAKKKAKKTRVAVAKNSVRAKKQEANKKLLEGDSLDLTLICDCTGSMGSWMKRAKETLQDIIKNVLSSHEGLNIRISFVGYRDFCDGARQFAILPFTSNVETVRKFIDGQPATGGGDMPENVVGAYMKVIALDWKADTRIAFHICDAPCHGRQYHNDAGVWDTKPKGHPSGTTLEQMMVHMRDLDVNLTFIKLTKHTDKMFEVMSKSYNTPKYNLELTDMDQTIMGGKTKEEIDKAFIEKASFIISKKVKSKRKAKKDPIWEGDITEGLWFSSTNYVKIQKIESGKVDVNSFAGGKWGMSLDLIQKMNSADHYDYEIPMSKGELVEMLESTKDMIFTICFKKKVNQKNVADRIVEEGEDFIGNQKKCKKLAKELLTGEECIIVGRMFNLEPKMGRSMIKDLRVPFGYNLRLVDHRTIQWIIFKNRKFVLKKPGKKYPVLPESALKIEDPIHTKWNLDKLSTGNWFSDTKYLKVIKILPDNLLEVKSADGNKLIISDDIVRHEMYSATHFSETEKVPRTLLAEVLEDTGNKVFTAVFNAKVNQKDAVEKLQTMPEGLIDDTRELNKFVRGFLKGREVTICAHLAKTEPKLGRSLVIGLDSEGKSNFRQIDHRGLDSIIFKNKKYIVK